MSLGRREFACSAHHRTASLCVSLTLKAYWFSRDGFVWGRRKSVSKFLCLLVYRLGSVIAGNSPRKWWFCHGFGLSELAIYSAICTTAVGGAGERRNVSESLPRSPSGWRMFRIRVIMSFITRYYKTAGKCFRQRLTVSATEYDDSTAVLCSPFFTKALRIFRQGFIRHNSDMRVHHYISTVAFGKNDRVT